LKLYWSPLGAVPSSSSDLQVFLILIAGLVFLSRR